MKSSYILKTLLLCTLCVPATAGALPRTKNVVLPGRVTVSSNHIRQGFVISGDGQKVLFVFDPLLFEVEKPLGVRVAGTFTQWKELPEWDMKRHAGSGLWYLEVPLARVKIPGNSGQPEFKFVARSGKPAGVWLSSRSPWQLGANNLLILPGDDAEELSRNMQLAQVLKMPADYDLSDPESVAMLANFRLAPGTSLLYRSYHPYKLSRALNKTEKMRVQAVKDLMKKHAIGSVICLSGQEQAFSKSGEEISVYHQRIIDSGNELFENANYNLVYFDSASLEFAQLVQRTVDFILDESRPGPFLVHCRLGTDRTGVMIAILAGLSGTSWKDIRVDYQKSNNMGMQEFRDYKLLKYSLEQIIGGELSDSTDLPGVLRAYFINKGYLTPEKIQALQKKLR